MTPKTRTDRGHSAAPTPTTAAAGSGWINPRAAQARPDGGLRRFVDPTTCERDYSIAEAEFMRAMQDYKARSGRMFPTWSEVLEVLRALGYEKPSGLFLTAPVAVTRHAAAG
jgi:hypothetical protein